MHDISPSRLPEAVTSILRPLESVGLTRSSGARLVGGKAATLGRLARDGFPVPQGWVLDTKRFATTLLERLPRGHDVASLIKIAGTKVGVDRSARARDRILEERLPSEIVDAIEMLWTAASPEAPWGLSVRSSATCEDDATSSLAGLATSILGVRGTDDIEGAIRQVWASLFLPRTLSYLARLGIRNVGMAVILQVMVPAESAGVLFTAPPKGLEGERWPSGERLVSATFGLGSPVVDGAAQTDTIRFNVRGEVVERLIADKRTALVIGDEGLQEVPIDQERAQTSALSEPMIVELAAMANRLEASNRGPLDVEFAIARNDMGGESIYLLQARPLTGGTFPEGGDSDTVWSRANIGEALPGAATPLTWSIAQSFSDHGFREAFSALGCRVPRGAVLVSNVYGRFYLNLSAFMQIASQVPGLTPRALLSVSGGAGEAAVTKLEGQSAHVHHRGFLLRAPFIAPKLVRRYAGLVGDVEAFEERAKLAQRSLFELDLSLLPDDALATTLRSARELLEETGGLMLTCASASLASHLALSTLLRQFLKRSPNDDSAQTGFGDTEIAIEPIVQSLTGGIVHLESASPGVGLMHVAAIADLDPEAKKLLLGGHVQAIGDLPIGPTRSALGVFLEKYGDRALREAELSTPRWREDAGPLLKMLVSALRGGVKPPDEALARARALSDRELANLETQIGRARLSVVRLVVTRTQGFTRLRERMRTWVTRVLGMLRHVALDVDRRLRRIDPSLAPNSVFFCTWPELDAALSSGRAEIGHVVRLRRAEHIRDRSRPDPPATFVGSPPPVVLPPAGGPRLVGLAASSGVVEGRARVLPPGSIELETVAPGEILVARTTDVGLSPLFLVAAAVVTELGGPLSHAAIVAREYGVPAVVNVPGATAAIRTGDLLRVDGNRGIVEKLQPSATDENPSDTS